MTRTNPQTRPRRRRIGAALTLTLGVLLAVLLPAGAADAAAYRYWGYYQLSGDTWQFATKGSDQTKPADGSVEGWRFAVDTEKATRFPRATPTFDQVCRDTEAATGKKRVAVVIDYGRAADTADNSEPPAPIARCALVPTSATGTEVLSQVAEVRAGKGLICGIDGFPADGCGEAVKTLSAATKAADTPVELTFPTHEGAGDVAKSGDNPHTGTYVGIGVAVLAAAAVAVAAVRRRRGA
jgi:hypothetical protein